MKSSSSSSSYHVETSSSKSASYSASSASASSSSSSKATLYIQLYKENDRFNISWEQKIRLWNAIVRGTKLSDGQWSGYWSKWNSVRTSFKRTRTVYSKEVLTILRRWIERVHVNNSDESFKSCMNSLYSSNHISHSESDMRVVMSVKSERSSSSYSESRTQMTVSRSSSSSSSSSLSFFAQMYKDTNRYDLSIEDRTRLWTSIVRGHKCSDGEWNTYLSKFNKSKTSFRVSKTVWNKDILVLIRRWIDRCHKTFSDSQWQSCTKSFYSSNHISCSQRDFQVITWVHSGGSYTESSSSQSSSKQVAAVVKQSSSSQKAVLATSGKTEVKAVAVQAQKSRGDIEIAHTEEIRTERVRKEVITEEKTSVSSSSSSGSFRASG